VLRLKFFEEVRKCLDVRKESTGVCLGYSLEQLWPLPRVATRVAERRNRRVRLRGAVREMAEWAAPLDRAEWVSEAEGKVADSSLDAHRVSFVVLENVAAPIRNA
jgi:hypothetical protein